MTIVENLQREDLNCLDQARAFERLSTEFGMTQEEIGHRTGLDRTTVSNYMRLLKLPGEVQILLENGELEFSHAKMLLAIREPEHILKVAKQAAEKRLSVDQLETMVIYTNYPLAGEQTNRPPGRARWADPNVRAAQQELQRILGVRVKIRDRRGKGKIVIEYASVEDYERIVGMLKGEK